MGWGENSLWDAARAERPLNELTNRITCDFLVHKDRGLDTSKILLPTVGGPNSGLSAEIVTALADGGGTEVTVLHVVDSEDEREAGERFLADWTADHGLVDAEQVVEVSDDVEETIEAKMEEHTLLFVGASEQGLLSRLVRNTLHFDLINETEDSVVIAERATQRSLWRRLFGR
jgi:nucleotide-binding universal stress UspA family protein